MDKKHNSKLCQLPLYTRLASPSLPLSKIPQYYLYMSKCHLRPPVSLSVCLSGFYYHDSTVQTYMYSLPSLWVKYCMLPWYLNYTYNIYTCTYLQVYKIKYNNFFVTIAFKPKRYNNYVINLQGKKTLHRVVTENIEYLCF